MSSDVEQSWRQITAWLQTHAPVTAATIHPPAAGEDILAIQRTLGQDLPAELLAWWRLMNGVDDDRDYRTAFTVPGFYMPLSVSRVREEWARLGKYADQDCCRLGR